MVKGYISKISGPLVVASGMKEASMYDMVKIGSLGLTGEIIEMHGDRASIQVYEETGGLRPGEEVISTGLPLSVELGPGLIKGIFDGIQRPLEEMYKLQGANIKRGISLPSLSRTARWHFSPACKPGDKLQPGDVIGTVQETEVVTQRIMLPYRVSGTVEEIREGDYTVTDCVGKLHTDDGKTVELKLMTTWPIRNGRPYTQKLAPYEPLSTGQRNVDTLSPIAKGGAAAIPGPFGSGKTVVQHQLAKWANADIVVYIGCGERGNEMTDVLNEFPGIKDPRSGKSLMERTVLIANTSDMPVAAREASIYTGITIAEYFRDMGYDVAIMADSTSRWAEALREMSGRLEEMPGEEGYPAYLGSRLAQFYERAGAVRTLGTRPRNGSLTAIGAVSPPGGDISEPVSQATLRIVKVFWGLDSSLAYARHFPAINWLNSYSLYVNNLAGWYSKNIAPDWNEKRATMLKLLQKEAELNEIVKLVGVDSLSGQDRMVLNAARSIREDYLQQDAMDDIDTHASYGKMYGMMSLILSYYEKCADALKKGVAFRDIDHLKVVERIGRIKFTTEEQFPQELDAVKEQLDAEIHALVAAVSGVQETRGDED